MTDQPNVGKPDDSGASSPPANEVSGQEGEPIQDVVTREEFSRFQKELRGLQGRQDKADTKLTGHDEAIARYQEKIDGGMKPAEAKKAMAVEDKADKNDALFQRLETFLSGADGKATSSSVNAPSEATRLINELELDGNAPEVTAVLAKGLKGLELENAMLRLNRPKSSASAPPPKTPSGTPSGSDDTGDLQNKLANLYTNYSQNLPEITKLEKTLRDRGAIQ